MTLKQVTAGTTTRCFSCAFQRVLFLTCPCESYLNLISRLSCPLLTAEAKAEVKMPTKPEGMSAGWTGGAGAAWGTSQLPSGLGSEWYMEILKSQGSGQLP